MNETECTAYLKKYNRMLGSRLGLKRMQLLLERLGNPQNHLSVVHVTGTNGKGSFCKIASSVLNGKYEKTGSFTSPYLLSPREEIYIDNRPVSKELFVTTLSLVAEVADSMEEHPTEFEMLTATALLLFKEEGCSFVFVEVGMGGRDDATNVFSSPFCSVITSISLDHLGILGKTREEIAEKKAGIIKKGCPVLFMNSKKQCPKALMEKAEKEDAPLFFLEKEHPEHRFPNEEHEISYKNTNLQRVKFFLSFYEKKKKVSIGTEDLSRGLREAFLPGRFEKIGESPLFYYDGAHNEEAMTEVVATLKKNFPSGVVLLMGVMADKNYLLFVKMLAPYVKKVITVTPDNPRALDGSCLEKLFLSEHTEAAFKTTIQEGVDTARAEARRLHLPVVALGSLYMYKDVRNALSSHKKTY